MKRRRFLQHVASGCAVVTLPAALSGCNVTDALQRPTGPAGNPSLDWFSVDERTLGRCLALLSANSAELADLYFQHRVTHHIDFANGQIADATVDVTRGAGLRSVVEDRTGFITTEDLTPEALLAAARRAAAIESDETVRSVGLSERTAGDLYRIAVPWSQIDVAPKHALIEKLDGLIRAGDVDVIDVTIRWIDQDERVLIATDDGQFIFDERPMVQLSLTVTAQKNGVKQSGFASIAARQGLDWFTDERLEKLAEVALSRTRQMFDAIRSPVGNMPVILAAGASGVLLHEAIGHSLEADFVRDGLSPYRDKTGSIVAKDFIHLVDQPDMPGARGALNVDDEGVATGSTRLIEGGRVANLLHDRTTARQMGVRPSGSGRRATFRDLPLPRMTCTYLENGPHAPDEILGSVQRGILCETYTGGQVVAGLGDFRFAVKTGWLIEHGKRVAPITGVDLIGNGPEMLANITMLGDDRAMDAGGWTCGKKGQQVPVSEGMPTALIADLQVQASS